MAGYAELHCHTNYSFLDGASHPEELAEEAARLGLDALAVTDHDGFYGIVRFALAARTVGLPTIFGTELTLGVRSVAAGASDPPGEHLIVLADGPVGYARLARAISQAQMAGSKGAPRSTLRALAEAARAPVHLTGNQASANNDSWFVLTGCRKGTVPLALLRDGPAAATAALSELIDAFGRARVLVELWDHGDPLDRYRNDALAEIAVRSRVEVVATNNVHYATSHHRPLADTLAAIRGRRSLDEMDGWLPAAPFAFLRSPAEQRQRFARWPGAVERTVEVAQACAFDLGLTAPNLPDLDVPEGHTDMSWLRELTWQGAAVFYPPTSPQHDKAARQIEYELGVIEQLGFPGYFLLLVDIVAFCKTNNIYCQGRGSAANSAVCYALGITQADAVGLGLLFERFLSPERDGPPDIDLDIEHQRREEVIQYVYNRYGRDRAAQVANVITYRARSAIREIAKAVGCSPGQADAIAKDIDRWGRGGDAAGHGKEPRSTVGGWPDRNAPTPAGAYAELATPGSSVPALAFELATELLDYPRHLGIHSGGMVMADRPLVECCPIEWGRMENRSVLQWDKDDCAAAGLVKFDLLGLGMLTMIHLAVDLIREHEGVEVVLATLPQEAVVYDLLTAADTVGVFQVESRAQMATLPRLRPKCFYDLVVEVALIRPGPIQGGSVHPYLRRRNDEEPVTYLHPLLEPCLKKTLGVPLFQEQLMQMAIDVANFTPGEADQLRQAMGSKRSHRRMAAMRDRLMSGMAANGITGQVAETIAHQLEAFADFGFPESHSVSFAYLVYASAWIKLHYPAEFTCSILNAQPMGFYSPHSLIRDAKHHGVEVLGPDINASRTDCTLEPRSPAVGPVGHPGPGWHADPSTRAVRIGLRYVRGLPTALLERIAQERSHRVFSSIEDFVRRTGANTQTTETLATAGAFDRFTDSRRAALWTAGALHEARPRRHYQTEAHTLPGVVTGMDAPALPSLSDREQLSFDLLATGLSVGRHPTEFIREALAEQGVVSIEELRTGAHGSLVDVAGLVTHRQQPATAKGVLFINLEDETGLLNVICTPDVLKRYRQVARRAPALLVHGLLERHQGVINLLARRLTALVENPAEGLRSRDFR